MAYQPKFSNKKKKRDFAWVLSLSSILFACLMILGTVMVLRDTLRSRNEQNAFRELASLVEAQTLPAAPQTDSGNASGEVVSAEETAPAGSPYQVLYEQNPDFEAWLTVPGTRIDYPVMHTPEDIEHYIYRAFDGSDSPSGTPFVGDYGDLNSQRCIIYGHNMGDGTMFHDLLEYMDKEFWEQNPTFTITTLTEKREYEIFAAVQTRLLTQEEQGLRFYRLEDGVEEWMIQRSWYDTGIVPAGDDSIVILSTCSYHTDNGRFIIAGRYVK